MKSTNRIQMQNVVPTEMGATLCISYIPAHDRRQMWATAAALLSGGAASRRPRETVGGRGTRGQIRGQREVLVRSYPAHCNIGTQ
jgi:hypothetical protein